MFLSYTDFCRKGKSGSAIGKDGVGRADTDKAIKELSKEGIQIQNINTLKTR